MPITARHQAALVALVAVGAYAWWVTGLPPFSTAATVAVLASGATVAMVSGSVHRVVRNGVVTPRSGAIWGALAVTLAAWELNAFVQHPRDEHPTLSSLADAMLDPRPVRTVVFIGWLAGTAWLARR